MSVLLEFYLVVFEDGEGQCYGVIFSIDYIFRETSEIQLSARKRSFPLPIGQESPSPLNFKLFLRKSLPISSKARPWGYEVI